MGRGCTMKRFMGIYMAILIGVLCTGCASEHREEVSIYYPTAG